MRDGAGENGTYISDDDLSYHDSVIPYSTQHHVGDIRPGHKGAVFELQPDTSRKPNVTIHLTEKTAPYTKQINVYSIVITNTNLKQVSILYKVNLDDTNYIPLITMDNTRLLHVPVEGGSATFFFDLVTIAKIRIVAEETDKDAFTYKLNVDVIGCRKECKL